VFILNIHNIALSVVSVLFTRSPLSCSSLVFGASVIMCLTSVFSLALALVPAHPLIHIPLVYPHASSLPVLLILYSAVVSPMECNRLRSGLQLCHY